MSYNNRPRVPRSRREYEAGVGVGPAEAINRHLRGSDAVPLWPTPLRGEAEGLEVDANDDWYEGLRSDDDEDFDPEEILRRAMLEGQREQESDDQSEEAPEADEKELSDGEDDNSR